MARKAPKMAVVRQLFAFSGNNCAFPECTENLIDQDNDFLGEICHIEAAEPLGQRYNELQDDEQRRSYNNLILLCLKHHKKTDNEKLYPTPVMQAMKASHESRFKNDPYKIPQEAEAKLFEILEQIHDDIRETLSLARRGSVTLEKIYKNTEAILASSSLDNVSPGSAVRIGVDESQLYSTHLEFIRRLRKDRKPLTALEELKRLEKHSWKEFDAELRYKVIANIAVALFDLGRIEEAGDYLLKLEQVEFHSTDYLGFLALGYAITNNKAKFDQLLDEHSLRESENSNLWIAYVNVYKDITSPLEIERAVPKSISSAPEILFAIGEAYLDAGDEKSGFSKFDQALAALGTNISERWHLQGVIATRKLLTVAGPGKIAFRAFDRSEKAQVQELVDLLTESWLHVAGTEIAKYSWHIILNRGVAYRALQNPVDAEKDFEVAWELTGNFASYKNLILQYLDTGEFTKAQNLIQLSDVEQIPGFSQIDYALLSARFGLATNDPQIATQILTAQLEKSRGDEKRLILDLIVVGLFEMSSFQQAVPFIELLIEQFPDYPQGYLAMATFLRKTERVKQADQYLEKTLVIMKQKPGPEWVWFLISEEFYQLKDYTNAVACLRNVYRAGIDYDVAHRLALASFYCGQYSEAENICRDIISVSKSNALAHEILFRIYENLGQNEDAAEIIRLYLRNGKRHMLDHFRLLGIKFYHSINDLENVRLLLSQIDDPTSYQLRQQFVIAQMNILYGQVSKGLEIAFDARIAHAELANAHEMFVNLLLRGRDQSNDEMFPAAVADMTAVEVVDKALKSSTYLITSDQRFSGADVLRPHDPMAIGLIGKKIGDMVTTGNSIGTGSQLTIKSIMSKYNHAFVESLKLLETKFAGQSQIVFFHGGDERAGDGGMNEFLRHHASTRRNVKEQILRFYNAGAATLGVVATYFGDSTIETWMELMAENSTGIMCYEKDESLDLEWTKSNRRAVVLETTALLTLFVLLDSVDLLDRQQMDLHVARATLDEIVAYRYKLEVFHTQKVSSDGMTPNFSENQDFEKQKDWCDRLINWCRTMTTQQIPKATISADHQSTELEDIIGKAAYHSLELCHQIGASLLSDDAKLKSLAATEYEVRSFSTYQLIFQLFGDGDISSEQFAELRKKLIRSNYIYIPLTDQELWDFFEETVFELKPPFTHSVRGLIILEHQVVVDSVVAFAKNLYLNTFSNSKRDLTLQMVMHAIKVRDDYNRLRKNILAAADQVFHLMPQQRDKFKGLISLL